jgi:hypothetical protein
MGFFSNAPSWSQNPFAQPAIGGLENFANNVSLGQAGRSAKGIIKQMKSGDYTNLAGTMLSPIHDSYATNLREAIRGNSMGANAFMQGWQPGLMAANEQTTRAKMAQDEGLAYGQAIPQLYNQATSTYQNAYNARNQNELQAREAALRGRIAGSQMYQTPSTWSNIVGFGQGLGQLAGMI